MTKASSIYLPKPEPGNDLVLPNGNLRPLQVMAKGPKHLADKAAGGVVSACPWQESARVQAEEIYDTVDVSPKFPGGVEANMKFLVDHVSYPKACIENGISGRVLVQFVVDKDGTLRNIKAIQSPDPRLSEEAVRVVKLMPKWEPGKKDGKAVAVRYVLPITFRLK